MTTEGIAVLEQPGLRERVAAELERAILLGMLAPGTRLVETELAARLGVSKTPVREALLALQQTGLVRVIPRRGAVVAGVTRSLIEELFALREVIEGYAVAQAFVHLTAADFAHLDHLVDRLVDAVRTHPEDYHLISDRDLAIHEYVFARSENTLLLDIWRLLRARMRMVHAYTRLGRLGRAEHAGQSGGDVAAVDPVVAQHRTYVAVLRQGNLERALEVTRQHLRTGRDLALRHCAAVEAHEAAAAGSAPAAGLMTISGREA